MPIAAVPDYMQIDDPEFYLHAPPGHRFLLYFPVWGHNGEGGRVDWRTKDRVKKFACTIAAGKKPAHFDETPRARGPKADQGLAPWRQMIEALVARQMLAAQGASHGALLRVDAIAQAPFTTGLGNEHPLENGFAFLNPYGLPYLPGSGVKGVLRQAARELARGEWGDPRGWSEKQTYTLQVGKKRIPLSMIDVLFGLESGDGDTEHVRGALSFWDVIPQIHGNSLLVEIMTPHQSHYYQQRDSAGSTSPHDSGSPNPIYFLTVPPGSGFTFHVVCDAAHLARLTRDRHAGAPDLLADNNGRPRWQALIEAAFEHAFTWLGFGAKTAVGYGAMEPAVKETSIGGPGPSATAPTSAATTAEWHPAKLVWDKGRRELKAVAAQGKSTAPVKRAEEARKLFTDPTLFDRLEKKGTLPNARVLVRIDGNMIVLVKVF